MVFECSEDTTKGPQGSLMHIVSIDEASNLFRAMATRSFKSNTYTRMAAGLISSSVDAVHEWLQEPDDEEPQLESLSLFLAASDE